MTQFYMDNKKKIDKLWKNERLIMFLIKNIQIVGDLNPQRLTEQMKFGLAGYDPEEPDMRGVFMARGPGKSLPGIETLETGHFGY